MGFATFIRTHNPFIEAPAAPTRLKRWREVFGAAMKSGKKSRPAPAVKEEISNQTLADANVMLGHGYLQSGKYELAIEAFNNAIRRDPEFAKAYFLLGMARACRGEYGLAIGHYSQAIALRPEQEQYYFCRARAWDAQRRPYDALADYARVLTLNPKHEGARIRHKELSRLVSTPIPTALIDPGDDEEETE